MTDRVTRVVELLGAGAIRRLAGEASYERGLGYHAQGRVRSLRQGTDEVVANVRGTDEYLVRLRARDGDLEWECSCPMGADGAFCKHCVAVAIAVTGTQADALSDAIATIDEVRDFLGTQPHERLVELVLEHAHRDGRLWEHLLLEMAKSRIDTDDLGTYRAAIDEAFATTDYIPYRYAYAYARGVHEVVDAIEELLAQRSEAVIELVEHALRLTEDALGHVDDSDGELGGVLQRIQDLHHEACLRTSPDPVQLARHLFAWELRTDWDTFYCAVETYADVLGAEGIEEYRRRAEERWAKVPVLGPGDDDGDRYGKWFRITKIMESLARRTGSLDALIEVHARDLSSAYCFLEIAELCREAGDDDRGMEWAERGLEAFSSHADPRLREFLAEEYGRRGRHDDALDLAWGIFEDRPVLDGYQKLQRHADRAGAWMQWRERALAHVREQITGAKREVKTSRRGPARAHWGADHSELVRIFLWEGDIEAAWQEAKTGGCADALWYELAETRTDEHPQDAVDVYKGLVDRTLTVAHQRNYEEAVRLLERISQLLTRLTRTEEFGAYVQEVREVHKRKKNLLKLLDRKRWG